MSSHLESGTMERYTIISVKLMPSNLWPYYTISDPKEILGLENHMQCNALTLPQHRCQVGI